MRARRVSSGVNRLKAAPCLIVALFVTGADSNTAATNEASRYLSPSTLAADPEGKYLYVAEFTGRQVAVFDTASHTVHRVIPLPDRPSGLALSPDGTRLYVTAGAEAGRVYVVDTKLGAVSGSIMAGHSPNAPVLSRDGKTLYVCNRHDNNVSVIDLDTKTEVATIDVTREPAAAILSADGRYLFAANQLPSGPANVADVAAVVSVIDTWENRLVTEIRLPNGSTGLRDLCLSPDGQYLYVTHLLGRYQLPTSQIERGWIYTNALSVIDAGKLKFVNAVLLDGINLGAANPWGVGCTEDGKYLCIAHAGTHEISVIDRRKLHRKLEAAAPGDRVPGVSEPIANVADDLSFMTGLRTRVQLRGNGPRGLVVIGTTVYTAEYFTDSLGVVDLPPERHDAARSFALGKKVPMTAERRGEMLFHDAQYSLQKWLSCTSCHTNQGRPDGLNWDLMLDGVGNPKNTKSLLLAHQTPPTTSSGRRARAEVSVRSGLRHIEFAERPEEDAAAIDAYLKSLKPVVSPYLEHGVLRAEAERGKRIFASAGCDSCHPSPLYTNLRQYDVGTGRLREEGNAVDTPTLIEVWRTAPYLHDGRAATIKDVFTAPDAGSTHNLASKLSEQQIDDLVSFVLSL